MSVHTQSIGPWGPRCDECEQPWPCRTLLVRELDDAKQRKGLWHKRAVTNANEMHRLGDALRVAEARLTVSQERIKRLEATLAFYADEDNWTTTSEYGFPDLWIVPGENGCDRARAALAADTAEVAG